MARGTVKWFNSQKGDADVAIEARYIVTGFKNRPTNETLASVAEVLGRELINALVGAPHYCSPACDASASVSSKSTAENSHHQER
jgi:hypothetical protein